MTAVALPRAVAARISVQGLATTQRVIAAVGSLVVALMVADVLVSHGEVEHLLIVVAPFVGIGVLALVLLWRPGVLTAVIYIAGGAILSVVIPVVALSADERFDDSGAYLMNRVATAICLVGAVGGSALNGMLWSSAAFVVGQSSVVVGLALAGSTVGVGTGPLTVFAISFAAYLTLALAQRQVHRDLAPQRTVGAELRGVDRRRELEARAAGLVHDTVLADLSAIARSPGPLTDRAREVLSFHLRTVAATTVADPPSVPAGTSTLGDALLELAHEYQWSGVRVDVSGAELLDAEVSAAVRQAILGATSAALDNVVRHAHTDCAELVAGIRDNRLSVLVVDDGVGFAPERVPADRLGVRLSIIERIEQVGGSVRLWSGPDGTTVLMSVPLGAGAP